MTYAKGYLISSDPNSEPGVPLIFRTESLYTNQPRSSVQAIYDQAELDINAAISYFEGATPAADKSNLSKNVAYGIKARIALNKGDWETAASAAALAREGYPLMDENTYKLSLNNYVSSEVMWGARVISTETNYYQSYFYFIGSNFNGTQNRTNSKMINKVEPFLQKWLRTDLGQCPRTSFFPSLFSPTAI